MKHCDHETVDSLSTRAPPFIISADRNGLEFWPFDQAQGNSEVMEPFLQFTVHHAPLQGNTQRLTSASRVLFIIVPVSTLRLLQSVAEKNL
jgi:hypothetical protein